MTPRRSAKGLSTRARTLDRRPRPGAPMLGGGSSSATATAEGEAQRRLEADRRGDQGGSGPGQPRGRDPEGRSSEPASRSRRSTRSSPRSRPTSRTSCSASRTRPTRRSRRWRGGQRHGPHLGRVACSSTSREPARSAWRRPRRRDVAAETPLGDRRGPRHHRPAARREDRRLRVPCLQGRRVAAPAIVDQLVPRRPRLRERHDRGLAAGPRQQ